MINLLKRYRLISALSIVLVIVLWEIVVNVGIIDARFLSPPSKVIQTFLELIINFEIFKHSFYSIFRVVIAFFISSVLGVTLGVLVGWSKTIKSLVQPLLEIIRPIPPLAWIPIAILWFGLGLKASVFIIFIGGFFPIFLNTVRGVENVDKKYIESAKLLGADSKNILTKVVIPSALPYIFTGLIIGLGISWMCLVAAEMFGESTGLGYFILESRSLMRPDKIIVGMLAIGLIGIILTYFFKQIERRVVKWTPNTH